MITQSQLKDQLHYNPDTGIFIRKKANSNFIKVGDVAGSLTTIGYIELSICGERHLAHRAAWLYVHGTFPKDGHTDHVNGIKQTIESQTFAA